MLGLKHFYFTVPGPFSLFWRSWNFIIFFRSYLCSVGLITNLGSHSPGHWICPTGYYDHSGLLQVLKVGFKGLRQWLWWKEGLFDVWKLKNTQMMPKPLFSRQYSMKSKVVCLSFVITFALGTEHSYFNPSSTLGAHFLEPFTFRFRCFLHKLFFLCKNQWLASFSQNNIVVSLLLFFP